MKINTKIQYAVRTMIELALDQQGKGLFQKEISELQGISYKYLDHIISALKAKDLVVNVEGKKSGYKLAQKPEQISMYDIFTAFESNISLVDSTSENLRSKAAEDLWWGLNKTLIEYLKKTNLRQMAQKQTQYNDDLGGSDFVI